MIRWIVLLAVVLVPFMAAAQSSDSSVCSDVLTKVAECFANSNTTAAFPTSDTSSCKGCFTNQNFFDNYDPTKASCDTANSEICEYLNICQQECYPTVEVCQNEYDGYFACVFSIDYAPGGCMVQKCERTPYDGTSHIGTSSKNAASSQSANVIMWVVTSALTLLAVVLLGNGLLLLKVAIGNASSGISSGSSKQDDRPITNGWAA